MLPCYLIGEAADLWTKERNYFFVYKPGNITVFEQVLDGEPCSEEPAPFS